MKFEPLSHEADLCLDIVLQEESFVFISNNETNVEMNLFAKSLILNKAFSYHEDQSNDVTDNDHCCKSKMNKDAKYNSYYSYYEESQKKIEWKLSVILCHTEFARPNGFIYQCNCLL